MSTHIAKEDFELKRLISGGSLSWINPQARYSVICDVLMWSHNSCSVRKNWKSSFRREYFSGNFWTLIRLWSPLMIIICFVLDTLSRRARLGAMKVKSRSLRGQENYDKWRLGHYDVWISFSWQFADNARWTQPRKKTSWNKTTSSWRKELKLIAGHLTSLRISFAFDSFAGRGWCLNPRHRCSTRNWFQNPHQLAGWSGFGLTLKVSIARVQLSD